MKISHMQQLLNCDVLCKEDMLGNHVYHAFAADLLSDALLYIKNQSVFITGLCNPQVLRTAEMLDIICVILVRGKMPDEEFIAMAKERNICLLTTKHTMFMTSGILYTAGLRGGA